MNKLDCLIIMFITCGVCDGQNLVNNPGFEQYSGCPDDVGQIDSAIFWTNPVNFPFSSSDYLNQCAPLSSLVSVPENGFGYQQAHNGNAYSGIVLFDRYAAYREYIEVSLTSTLNASSCYLFEMYINLGENSKYTADDIGVFFSDTLVTGYPGNYILPSFSFSSSMPVVQSESETSSIK